MSDIRFNSWLHRSGTGGVYQDSSGRVGIGTSSPGEDLHISSNSPYIKLEDIDNSQDWLIRGTAWFDIYDVNNSASRLVIDSTGRVGINTATMTTANAGFDDLVIRSSAGGNTGITFLSSTTAQGTLAFADGSSSTAPYRGYLQYSHNGDRLVLGAGGADRVTVDTDGNVNISGVTTAKSFVPTEGQLSHKNLIINGAMTVAQRGTSSTTSNDYVCDRFNLSYNGQDEVPTFTQAAVASGTTPYNLGFRNCLKVTNGNQTGGVGSSDYIQIKYVPEAQDIATSGWNYKSASSYITLSFWIKSSVAQAFTGSIWSRDGTQKNYKFDTPSLSADTWTKVTKIIPGHADLSFDNDSGIGAWIFLYPMIGQSYTTSASDTETWIAHSSGAYANNITTTWWTTNDATFEITGVQLEVGSVATPFEHRSYGDELKRCKRYYQQYPELAADGYAPYPGSGAAIMTTTTAGWAMNYDTMRASPTVSWTGNHRMVELNTDRAVTGFAAYHGSASTGWMVITASGGGMTAGNAAIVGRNNDTTAFMKFSAEL